MPILPAYGKKASKSIIFPEGGSRSFGKNFEDIWAHALGKCLYWIIFLYSRGPEPPYL